MILNNEQLKKLKQFILLVQNGESKVGAAAIVDVSRSTLTRWEAAENAPTVEEVVAEAESKKKAKKAPVKKVAAKKAAPVKKVTPKAAKKAVKKAKKKAAEVAPLPNVDVNSDNYKRLVKIVAEQLGVPESDVSPEKRFVEDLGADSLDTVELVMALEDEFGLEVPDGEADNLTTTAQAYDYLVKRLEGKAESKEDELVPFQAVMTVRTMTIIRDGKPVQVDKSHANYEAIRALIAENLKNGQILASVVTQINELIDVKTKLAAWSNGRITVNKATGVLVDGKPLIGELANVMLNALSEGADSADVDKRISRFVMFHDKAAQMVDRENAPATLFKFLSKSGLRLSETGNIIALKVVRNNYLDKHSGTMDNSPGKEVKMKREDVDNRDHVTCSRGLHVCAPGYISHFASSSGGDRLVECEVDPRDFVSIPADYNFDKARVCRYIVLRDVSETYKKELYNTKAA